MNLALLIFGELEILTKKRYTFRQPTPFIQRRLDFFFISNSLQENVEKVDIIPAVRTDHSALLMKINTIQTFQRGRGYWKFNNSLLSNSSFVELMQKEIKSKTCNISDISVTNLPKCSICTRLPSRDVSSVCLASWLISYDLVLSSLSYSFSLYNITW